MSDSDSLQVVAPPYEALRQEKLDPPPDFAQAVECRRQQMERRYTNPRFADVPPVTCNVRISRAEIKRNGQTTIAWIATWTLLAPGPYMANASDHAGWQRECDVYHYQMRIGDKNVTLVKKTNKIITNEEYERLRGCNTEG